MIQQQLQSLLETLSATEPHYIRCVKPNNLLKPAIFENQNILQQLRCGVCFHNFMSFNYLKRCLCFQTCSNDNCVVPGSYGGN